jgi:calcium-dependent protein kinase
MSASSINICNISYEEMLNYKIKKDKFLGKGTFGTVFLGVDIRNNDEIAIKIINKTLVKKHITEMIKECNILNKLNHPNIIKIYGGYNSDKNIYWITEYLKGGELFDIINNSPSEYFFDEHTIFNIFNQICSAVEYCHNKNIIHRDIKLQNVMIKDICNYHDLSSCTVKLIDFGLAKKIKYGELFIDITGSPTYCSPEILYNVNREKDKRVPYDGKKADIWALGILLTVFSCKKRPFVAKNIETLRNKVLYFEPSFCKNISLELLNLINRLLSKNPDKRITFDKIKIHPWFTKTEYTEMDELSSDEYFFE